MPVADWAELTGSESLGTKVAAMAALVAVACRLATPGVTVEALPAGTEPTEPTRTSSPRAITCERTGRSLTA
jgi:hypothetical protein